MFIVPWTNREARAEDKVPALNLGDLIKQRRINIVTVFLSNKAFADFVSWLCSFMVALIRHEKWSNDHRKHACLRHHTDRDFICEHHWGIERALESPKGARSALGMLSHTELRWRCAFLRLYVDIYIMSVFSWAALRWLFSSSFS